MKKKSFVALLFLFLCSCSVSTSQGGKDYSYTTSEDIFPYKSNIKKDDCYLCGNGNSLMSYYSKFDSIGVICLNTWQILDSHIRNFDDDGNPQETKGSRLSLMNCGENECVFSSSTSSNRIMANLTYHYRDESIIKKEELCDELCQECLEAILKDSFHSAESSGRFHDAILVDFKEKKPYPITKNSSFFIRDYYVHIDDEKDGGSIVIIYCPELE